MTFLVHGLNSLKSILRTQYGPGNRPAFGFFFDLEMCTLTTQFAQGGRRPPQSIVLDQAWTLQRSVGFHLGQARLQLSVEPG